MKDGKQQQNDLSNIPIKIYQCQQTYRDKLNKFVSQYLVENKKQKLLQTLKLMSYSYQQSYYQLQSSLDYFHKFVSEFNKILNQHNHNVLFNANSLRKVDDFVPTQDQSEKITGLIKSYQSKIINHLVNIMKNNSLLRPIKNSKLQQIARTYSILQLSKQQAIQYKINELSQQKNLYYLFQGDIQKIRYYSFHNKNINNQKSNKYAQTFSLKHALQKINQSQTYNDKKQQIKNNNQTNLSTKISKDHHQNISSNSISNTNSYPLKSILLKRKSLSRHTLRTLIQPGQFVGDQFFNNQSHDQSFPTITKYLVVSQKATLIQFSGQLIIKILNQYNYHQDSKSFYHQKSSIELKQIHSMRLFDKRYKSLCQKKQQNFLKRQCSPQLQQKKKIVLKRYLTSNSQSQVDINSPKKLFKILSKRKKKMNINRKNNFQLPVVQVFSTHSQKKRSHQNVALSPMAIVKTNRNNALLNKPDNIISQGEKSQIYQIREWKNSTQLEEEKISPSMKQLHQITKQKRHNHGGFQLLQLERVLQKIKVNLKKR